jgi:hypothetical protein
MEKAVKTCMILMAILTAIYASVVVYAYAHSNLIHDVVYAAYECEISPTDWYTPEELGIVKIIELGENADCLQIVVDQEKEPFPLQSENPIFLYKDKFYRVSSRWVTFVPEIINNWQIPIAGALGTGWLFSGVLFLKGRKRE